MTVEPSPIDIRLGTSQHAAEIGALIARVWIKNFGYSVSPDDILDFRKRLVSTEAVIAQIQDPRHSFIIATTSTPSPSTDTQNDDESETVIGVLHLVSGTSELCLTLPKPIELHRLYVDDGYHGKGVAQGLFAYATEKSRADGYASIWLGVWENNPKAQAFYQKIGFKEVGEHSFVIGKSVRRDLVLERPL